MRKKSVFAAVLFSLVSAFAVPVALAHVVYNYGWQYWTSNELCVRNYSEISHGGGGGYNKERMNVYESFNGTACNAAHSMGAYQKRAGFYNVKKAGSSYVVCTSTYPFWVVDAQSDAQHTVNASSTVPPCDYGTYGTFGLSDIIVNGAWVVYGSGSHAPNTGTFSGWHDFLW